MNNEYMHIPINANKNVHKIIILNISLYSNVCHSHIQQELQRTEICSVVHLLLDNVKQTAAHTNLEVPLNTRISTKEFQIDTFAYIVTIKFKT